MVAPVIFSGIDIATVMAAASAQPVGSQKAKYAADVAAALGSNPILRIRVPGASPEIVYATTIPGSLIGTASGISIPAQFVEPPTVNLANALAEAVLEIGSASNSAVKVSMPLKAAVAEGYITASHALDGTRVARASSLLLAPPNVLDVGGGSGGGTPPAGSPTIGINTLVDLMTTPDQNPQYGIPPARQASIQTPINYNAIREMCTNYPSGVYRSDFYEKWDALACWLWFYWGLGHTAVGKRVETRNMVISILRASNNTWVDSPVRQKIGGNDGQRWNGTVGCEGSASCVADYLAKVRTESSGNLSYRLNDGSNQGVELWPNGNFYTPLDRSLMRDAKAGAIIAQIRVINDDGTQYSGTDAKVCAAIGFDQYASGRNVSGQALGSQGNHMMDGGKCRWKTYDCSTGWQSVAMVTMRAYKRETRPPWTSGWITDGWAFSESPYVLTEAEVRANPPSWVTA